MVVCVCVGIPQDKLGGITTLADILADAENVEAFLNNSSQSKKYILQGVLGDNSELVEEIIKCASEFGSETKDAGTGTTLYQLVEDYRVTPSKVKPDTILDVASYLMNSGKE